MELPRAHIVGTRDASEKKEQCLRFQLSAVAKFDRSVQQSVEMKHMDGDRLEKRPFCQLGAIAIVAEINLVHRCTIFL